MRSRLNRRSFWWINLDRYNYLDGRSRLIHLSDLKGTCLICDLVGRVSITSTPRDRSRESSNARNTATSPVIKIKKRFSPTRDKWREIIGYITYDARGLLILCLLIHGRHIYILNIICVHVMSLPRRLARVHVAEPRGLACHVASTWARALINHFLHFFI